MNEENDIPTPAIDQDILNEYIDQHEGEYPEQIYTEEDRGSSLYETPKTESINPVTSPKDQGVRALTPNINNTSSGREPTKVDVGLPEDEEEFRKIIEERYGMTVDEWKNSDFGKRFLAGFMNQGITPSSAAGPAVGLGLIDFGMDVLGHIPKLSKIDDAWDEHSKFGDEGLQKIRKISSVVLPTIMLQGKANKMMLTKNMPAIQKGIARTGLSAAIDIGVIGLSDEGEEHNAFRMLDDLTDGRLNIPNSIKTLDGDSSEVRRYKNMLESGTFVILADALGHVFQAGKPIMRWFKPNDDKAKVYKNIEQIMNADETTLKAAADIENQLEFNLDQVTPEGIANSQRFITARDDLIDQVRQTGTSTATPSPAESYVARAENSRQLQTDEIASKKLLKDVDGSNPDVDIYSRAAPYPSIARQSMDSGNVAKNMLDTTAIKKGSASGDPSPLLSDPMLKQGLEVKDSSRNVLEGIAYQASETGDWTGIVNGFRYTKSQMDDAAWEIYQDILRADSPENLKKLFVTDILDGSKENYIKLIKQREITARGAAFALKDLTDRFLGRDITVASARTMDTLGREVSSIAEGAKKFEAAVDENRVSEMILDKMEFLMQEYGLNKYISGWQLQNKKWWKTLENSPDPNSVIKGLDDDFNTVLLKKKKEAKHFRNEISRVKEANPLAARVLMDAFVETNGNVDTLAKLYQWAGKEISPLGLLKGNKDGLNTFANGLWAIRYNNMLSGLSAARAGLGNSVLLTMKTINTLLGTGASAALKGDFRPVKRALYGYSGWAETNRRALGDSWEIFRKANKDPESVMNITRRDYAQFSAKQESKWELLDETARLWEKEEKWGHLFFYNWSKLNKDVSNWPVMRWGLNAMAGQDAGVRANLAIVNSRMRAYDEVIESTGRITPDSIMAAEKKIHSDMFDANGMIRDEHVLNASGEISLNIEDDLASDITKFVNRYPFLKSFFMFPTTRLNQVKYATSYTPLMAIPGMNKYAKVLQAGDDIDLIKVALAEHGIKNFDETPHAMSIYKDLQAEYRGRLAFSGLLTSSLFGYALGGNIRGNGPRNPSERRNLRDNYNYRPKTIKLPLSDTWVSYEGIEPFDTILTLVGDTAMYATDVDSSILEDIHLKLAWSLSATFVNNTVATGLEPFIKILNGDETAMTRFFANEAKGMIPMYGANAVISNAITSTVKDIHNDFFGYVMNKMPIASSTLAERKDIWTGKPLNDIDNPFLRGLNAISPVKFSEGQEPWRQWLMDTGWDGQSILRRSTDGKYQWNADEREILYGYIGEMQLWRQVEKMMKSKKYNDSLNTIRAHRASGKTWKEIQIITSDLELYKDLNAMMRNAIKIAEHRLVNENPRIAAIISANKAVKGYMEQSRVQDSIITANQGQKSADNPLTHIMNIPK